MQVFQGISYADTETKEGNHAIMISFFCEEAHKRCVGVGKNAKKVRNNVL